MLYYTMPYCTILYYTLLYVDDPRNEAGRASGGPGSAAGLGHAPARMSKYYR